MADHLTTPDRRRPGHQRRRADGQRVTDHHWTVPQIAQDLGLSPRSVVRKFLRPEDGSAPLLEHYDWQGTIRVPAEAYQRFKAKHFKASRTEAADAASTANAADAAIRR
jgi:hypothetical protein